jgi:1,4-alpha-glucan branching enzyme
VKNGKPFPLGSALSGTGANFSVYSSQATEVQLVLFDSGLDARADRILKLDASVNRTAHYWHIFVDGVRPGQRYGYRMDGPHNPEEGLRFNSDKLLLDPYGRHRPRGLGSCSLKPPREAGELLAQRSAVKSSLRSPQGNLPRHRSLLLEETWRPLPYVASS